MPRRDRAYWARLRVDARSNWAGGLALIAVLAAAVAVIGLLVGGPPGVARSNPIYWLIFLPMVWWGSGLMGFEPGNVRAMAPLTYLAPFVALFCLVIAGWQGVDRVALIVVTAISASAAIGSRIAYRGSLLQTDGPAR